MPWVPVDTEPAPQAEGAGLGFVGNATQLGQDDSGASASESLRLNQWDWQQYTLSTDLAAKLGFAVTGGKSEHNARTVVAEFSRTRVEGDGATRRRVGVATRLVVQVSGLSASANLSLPVIAAEAQVNRIEATASLQIRGFLGKDLGKLMPSFSAFDVETYVKLLEAMTALKDSISEQEERISPVVLWQWSDATETVTVDDRLTVAVGTVWALSCIQKGWEVNRAIGEYKDIEDAVAHDAISRTYADLTESDDGQREPNVAEQERARTLLDGYKLRGGVF